MTSFSDGSIIAAIELYFDELSNATEIEVYNETIAALEENNITAEVTRVECKLTNIYEIKIIIWYTYARELQCVMRLSFCKADIMVELPINVRLNVARSETSGTIW